MDAKIYRLVTLVDDAAAMLRAEGYEFWAKWLEKGANAARDLDLWGIEYILGAYGGMGSINDITVTDRLDCLLNEIYATASELRREELLASSDDDA